MRDVEREEHLALQRVVRRAKGKARAREREGDRLGRLGEREDAAESAGLNGVSTYRRASAILEQSGECVGWATEAPSTWTKPEQPMRSRV